MAVSIKKLQFDKRVSPGIEIISVDEQDVQTWENLLVPHRANFFCVLWIYSGRPVHTVDFEPVTVKGECFLFVGKDRVQFFDQGRPFKAKILLFTEELLKANFLERSTLFNRIDGQVTQVGVSEELRRFWEQIERELSAESDRYKTEMLANHLGNFLLQSEREANLNLAPEADAGLELLFRFRELIEANYRDLQPVSFYTDSLGVSGKVLARVTAGLSGKTPKQWLDERVVLEAKRMLIHSEEAGKGIGYELGFMEPTNFIKFFRKHTGTTPSVFRETYFSGRKSE